MGTQASKLHPQKDTEREDITLSLLSLIETDSSVTQRSIANQLGIALGLVNTYLKRCTRKGLIKVKQAPTRRYAYYLTPKGFVEKSHLTAQFLRSSFTFMRRAQSDCEQLLSELSLEGAKRVILLGDGDLANVILLLARNSNFSSVEVASWSSDPSSQDLSGLDADVYVVTCLESPLAVYKAALSKFGPACVKAPSILRLPDPEDLLRELGTKDFARS